MAYIHPQSGRRVLKGRNILGIDAHNGRQSTKKAQRKVNGRGEENDDGKRTQRLVDKKGLESSIRHKTNRRDGLLTPAAREELTTPPNLRQEKKQLPEPPPGARELAAEALRERRQTKRTPGPA